MEYTVGTISLFENQAIMRASASGEIDFLSIVNQPGDKVGDFHFSSFTYAARYRNRSEYNLPAERIEKLRQFYKESVDSKFVWAKAENDFYKKLWGFMGSVSFILNHKPTVEEVRRMEL